MTEDQIERWVERQVDALDKRYLTSAMTQADYNARMAAIDRSAKGMAQGIPHFTALVAHI